MAEPDSALPDLLPQQLVFQSSCVARGVRTGRARRAGAKGSTAAHPLLSRLYGRPIAAEPLQLSAGQLGVGLTVSADTRELWRP